MSSELLAGSRLDKVIESEQFVALTVRPFSRCNSLPTSRPSTSTIFSLTDVIVSPVSHEDLCLRQIKVVGFVRRHGFYLGVFRHIGAARAEDDLVVYIGHISGKA
jgi:hypothetical protein